MLLPPQMLGLDLLVKSFRKVILSCSHTHTHIHTHTPAISYLCNNTDQKKSGWHSCDYS